MKIAKVGHRIISRTEDPFIIAEMSGNHNQSLERALRIVEAAAKAGADAIKLQTYTADTLTIDSEKPDFRIDDKESLWTGETLYHLYKKAYTPWEWHKAIFDKAHELGLLAFSTPFDEKAVDFLESLDVPMYKIASFENSDLPLIEKVASTGKPLIISTGMASVAELEETVQTAKIAGCKDLILLKCTSTYPASAENTNLITIPHLRELFDCQVGLSDHTLGIGTAIASVALGATVIEKHLTLDRDSGGVDSDFSMEPDEFSQLVTEVKQAKKSLGKITYGPTEAEKSSLKFRRSIYITENMDAGEILTPSNVRVIRPGFGLEPKYYNLVLGKTLKKNAARGTALSWDLLL